MFTHKIRFELTSPKPQSPTLKPNSRGLGLSIKCSEVFTG